jgi:hypothetical protein
VVVQHAEASPVAPFLHSFGGAARLRVEHQQPACTSGRLGLQLLHQRVRDAAAASLPVHEQLGDLGAMVAVGVADEPELNDADGYVGSIDELDVDRRVQRPARTASSRRALLPRSNCLSRAAHMSGSAGALGTPSPVAGSSSSASRRTATTVTALSR